MPIGKPPAYLDTTARKVCAELVKSSPAGVLTSADRIMVEAAVGLIVKMRPGTPKTLTLADDVVGLRFAVTLPPT